MAQRHITQLLLSGSSLWPPFLEPIGDDDDGPNTLSPALVRHFGDKLGRHDDYSQVHLPRDIEYGRIGFYRHYGIRLWVHRIDDAGKSAFHDVLEDQMPDAARLPGSAYHRY